MALVKYFKDIYSVGKSIAIGMRITIGYFFESLLRGKHTITIQYPREKDFIPERHRGLHFLETEKCILCYKCADACPVDCIYIEGLRGNEGVLPDGWRGTKVTLSKFTIDFSVCMFCGLCEEACPPGCLHLGLEWDALTTDRTAMERNLLTDALYTPEDEAYAVRQRAAIEKIKAEKAKAQAAAKAAAAAAKAAPKPPASPGGAEGKK
jgi:formate hydrogenlyase subunit 6/NADH:ubiquinone oxidoreductase subunit I